MTSDKATNTETIPIQRDFIITTKTIANEFDEFSPEQIRQEINKRYKYHAQKEPKHAQTFTSRYMKKPEWETICRDGKRTPKKIWNELANQDNELFHVTITERKANDSWIFAIELNEGPWKGSCGSSQASRKDDAEGIAYYYLYQSMYSISNHHTTNGERTVVRLNKLVLNIKRFDETVMITLPNRFNFTLNRDEVSESEDFVELSLESGRVHDEVIGRIASHDFYRTWDLRGINKIQTRPQKNQIHISERPYANHQDYSPQKRFTIAPVTKIRELLESQENNGFGCETNGSFVHYKNILFAPVNTMSLWFQKNEILMHKITPEIMRRCRMNIEYQEMTPNQMAQTCAIFSTLQMSYLRCPDVYELKLGLFGICFKHNLQSLTHNKNVKFSVGDVYYELSKLDLLIIPTNYIHKKKYLSKYLRTQSAMTKLDENFVFENSENGFDILRTHLGVRKQNDCSIEDLVEGYCNGEFDSYAEIVPKIDFHKPRKIIGALDEDVSPETLFLKFLVTDRFSEENLRESLNKSVRYLETLCSEELLRRTVNVLSKKQFLGIESNKLRLLFSREPIDVEFPEMDHRIDKIDFIVTHLKHERLIAQTAQAEFDTWASILGFQKRNVFNNPEYIIKLAHLRRNKFENTTGSWNFETEQKTEVKTTWYQKMKQVLMTPITVGKNIYTDVADMKTKMQNFSIENLAEVVVNRMQNMGMPNTVDSIGKIDFGSISSSVDSVKMLINGFFHDFANKMCQLFGVTYVPRLDATLIAFYYIIFVRTECKKLKTMLIMDIAVQLGIADKLWTIIKSLMGYIKGLLTQRPTVTTREEDIASIVAEYNQVIQKRTENLKKEVDKNQYDFSIAEDEDDSWIDMFWKFFSQMTPYLLGGAATALLVALGITKSKHSEDKIGIDIVQTMRNISFISLGLVAVPKIFQNVIGILTWVMDHVKGLFLESHQVKSEKHRQVADFISKVTIIPGLSEYTLMLDVGFIFKVLSWAAEIKEINEFIMEIEPTLAVNYRIAANQVLKILPLAISAMTMTCKQREPFHLVFYSSKAGVGKTDLGNSTLRMIQEAMKKNEENIAKTTGYPYSAANDRGAFYPLNDTLSHCDNYYGQEFAILDDSFLTKEIDPDVLTTKIMMFGQNPTMTRQADLSSKGRMFSLQAVVSNTNNSHPEPLGLAVKTALWRRRLLVEVEVRPDCLTEDKIDDTKIAALGLNRNLSEHLLCRFIKSEEPNKEQPIKGRELGQISVKDMQTIVCHKAMAWQTREEHRLWHNDGFHSVLRSRFAQLKSMLFEQDKNASLKQVLDEVSKRTAKAKELFNNKKSKNLADNFIKQIEEDQKHLELLSPFVEDANREEHAMPSTSVTTGLLEGLGTTAYYDIETKNIDGRYYSVLTKSERRHVVKDGLIDLEMFKVKKLRENNLSYDRVVYESPDMPTAQEKEIILHYLLQFSVGEVEDFPKLVTKAKAKMMRNAQSKKKEDTWADYFKSKATKMGLYAQWLMEKTVEIIGEGILVGLISLVAIFVGIFVVSTAASFFAPTMTSYNSRFDRKSKLTTTSAAYDNSTYEVVKRNTFKLYCVDDLKHYVTTIIGLRGNIFLTNQHFADNIKQTTTIYVYDHAKGEIDLESSVTRYTIKPSDFHPIPNKDAALLIIKDFRNTRDITKHFISEADLVNSCESLRATDFTSILLRDQKLPTYDKMFKNAPRKFTTLGRAEGMLVNYNAMIPKYKHDVVFELNNEREGLLGDSGSIVLHNENRVAGKILGIVLSANLRTTVTFCGVITSECLERTIKSIPSEYKITTLSRVDTILVDHPLQEVFKYPKTVTHSPIPNQSVSRGSGFVKSPIHGVVEVETEPALQDQRDSRIPPGSVHHMAVALNKMNGDKLPYYSEEEQQFMKSFLKYTYTKTLKRLGSVKYYNTKQAITGIRMKGSTSIDTRTSAGLPYKLEKGVVGKRPFICVDPISGSYNIANRVFEEVDHYEEQYNNCKIPYNQKLEFRKHELVGHNKIYDPKGLKTRTVGLGNMIHLIIYRKIFGDLHTFMKNVWDEDETSPFAMGIDPERHWDLIARHLRYHDYIIDFDVKAWESTVGLTALRLATEAKIDLIEHAYRSRGESPPKKRQIALALAHDFMDTDVVYEDIMYHKNAGLVSGHPGTFMENSEMHIMLIAVIIRKILLEKKPEFATVGFIFEHFRFMIAADDILIAISPKARYFVNVNDIVSGYKARGITVTSPDKTENIKATTIEGCQFLKHHFKKIDSEYVSVPNASIYRQLFNWIRDDTELTLDEQFLVNVNNAFRILHRRGVEEYETIREMVNLRMTVKRMQFTWPYDYHDMKQVIDREKINTAYLDSLNKARVDKPESDYILF